MIVDTIHVEPESKSGAGRKKRCS